MQPQTVRRYVKNTPKPAPIVWRKTYPIARIDAGRRLRLEFLEPARVHWSSDEWSSTSDTVGRDTGMGTYICDLPTQALARGSIVRFTIYWSQQHIWEGTNFAVSIGPSI
jgi:glucoamylase